MSMPTRIPTTEKTCVGTRACRSRFPRVPPGGDGPRASVSRAAPQRECSQEGAGGGAVQVGTGIGTGIWIDAESGTVLMVVMVTSSYRVDDRMSQ